LLRRARRECRRGISTEIPASQPLEGPIDGLRPLEASSLGASPLRPLASAHSRCSLRPTAASGHRHQCCSLSPMQGQVCIGAAGPRNWTCGLLPADGPRRAREQPCANRLSRLTSRSSSAIARPSRAHHHCCGRRRCHCGHHRRHCGRAGTTHANPNPSPNPKTGAQGPDPALGLDFSFWLGTSSHEAGRAQHPNPNPDPNRFFM